MRLSAAILVAATTLCSAQIGIEKFIPKAQVYLSQGKLDLAEGEARQALANNEDVSEAHNILGLIAERRRRLPEAEDQFRIAGKLNPGSAVFQHNLGNVLMAQKKREEAIRAFERAVKLDPGDLDSHYMLARTYGEQKRFDLAVTHLELVRSRNSTNVQVLLYLCEAYFRIGRTQDGLNAARSIAAAGGGVRAFNSRWLTC